MWALKTTLVSSVPLPHYSHGHAWAAEHDRISLRGFAEGSLCYAAAETRPERVAACSAWLGNAKYQVPSLADLMLPAETRPERVAVCSAWLGDAKHQVHSLADLQLVRKASNCCLTDAGLQSPAVSPCFFHFVSYL